MGPRGLGWLGFRTLRSLGPVLETTAVLLVLPRLLGLVGQREARGVDHVVHHPDRGRHKLVERVLVEEKLPEDRELYSNLTATLHYAKGVAHAALGEVEQAEAEQALFLAARDRIPETRRMHNVLCHEQLAVAEAMLDGEIAYRKGDHYRAFARLRDAVALEDELPYDEPWGWMQPTRHALGALLFEQGRIDEAEAADLRQAWLEAEFDLLEFLRAYAA